MESYRQMSKQNIPKKNIDIIEVGPRDGFQNLSTCVPIEVKLNIINGLIECGVRHMQIGSFVSPRSVPQMSDTTEICKEIVPKYDNTNFFALIPNYKGAELAVNAGLKKVTYVISLSVTHNKKNINRTHKESFGELKRIKEDFPSLELALDVATAFGCPFEGKYNDHTDLLNLLEGVSELGVGTFNLCDTVGLADPAQVRRVVCAVKEKYPDKRLEVHIHDTRAMGLVNTLAAIECGVDGVQSTLGGLGGCPFAPGASGNTSTEDLVYMLREMDYETGIDVDAIITLAKKERRILTDGNFSGHQINIK